MTENTSSSAPAKDHIDRASLLERVEGDQDLLAEMVRLFVDDSPRLLQAMRAALEQGDMVTLERSAHSVKGAAGNLSAAVTAAAALQLEKDAKNRDAESARTSLASLEQAVERLLPLLAEFCQGAPK